MDIIQIPLAMIDEDTEQPRYQFGEDSLQELMTSIAELGLLSPIKVRNMPTGRYMIIYGNRRYKACRALNLAVIPCIVSTVSNETDIYLEQIAENLTREGFSPIEEADAFHKLLHDAKFSSSTKYLSSKLGKPEAYIKNKLELLKFGPRVKKLIVGGTEIKKGTLTEEQLLPLKDLAVEHRDPVALLVAKEELPVSDVKKISRLFKDAAISASTKDKLLFKTGFELLQTWSVFEQNRAERAKPTQPKPSAKQGKQARQEQLEQERGAALGGAEQAGSGQHSPFYDSSQIAQQAADQLIPIISMQQRLLSVLPTEYTIAPAALQSLQSIDTADKAAFISDMNKLISQMENHLEEWKRVKVIVDAAN